MLQNFVTDAERVIGVKNNYLCPICSKSFIIEGTKLPNGLTKEHVPPQSLGGTVRCYTCRDCNSGAGALIDNELLKGIQFNKKTFFDTMIEQKARVSRGTKTMQATITNAGKDFTLKHSKKNNHPSELEKFINDTKKGTKLDIKYIIPNFDEHLFNVGLLKSAYLMAFENQGFELLTSSDFDIVRQQIITPNKKIYPFHHTILKNAFTGDKEGIYLGEMDGKKVMVAVFNLSFRMIQHTFGVMLPCPENPLIDFISATATFLSYKNDVKFASTPQIQKTCDDRLTCEFTPIAKRI